MNLNLYDAVYNGLKEKLDNSTYKPFLLLKPNQTDFPQVILEEIDNIPIDKINECSIITFEADIYAKDIGAIDNMEIAREIQKSVDDYLGIELRMNRTLCSPTPNADTNLYRITMRYNAYVYNKKLGGTK